jgi:uncharacterized Zn finger protein
MVLRPERHTLALPGRRRTRGVENGNGTGRGWKSHPADSVRVYQDHVAALLRNTGDGVYREAIGFMEKIETLLVRCGQDTAFGAFLAELRATHRRKRNFMKMLDRKGW